MIRARGPAASAFAVVIAALAVLLAGCGGSGAHRASTATTSRTTTASSTATTPSSGSLRVRPSQANRSSEIAFGFTAPAASGVHGTARISYSLSVTGPAGAGCVGVHETSAPRVARGQRVTITLGPAELHAPWCPGAYTARAFELQRAACTGSQPCPQYIRVVAIVGRAAFRVTAG